MTRLARLDGPARLQGVDLARGLAVLGMFVSHLVVTEPFDFADPSTWSDIAYGRSSILFATLAGVSIGLVTGGPRRLRGAMLGTAAARLVVRAFLLLLLGVLLIGLGVPVVNILPTYAILFLLALPLLTVPARVLLPIALALALVTPFLLGPIDAAAGPVLEYGTEWYYILGWHYPFVVWISFLTAGLALARADLRSLRTQTVALVGGAVLALVGYGLDTISPLSAWMSPVWTSEGHSSGLLEVIGSGGFAIAVIGASCLVCHSAVVRTLVLPLRAVGSMPLTAYTAQVLAWWFVATVIVGDMNDILGLKDLGFFWYLTVGTVVACTAWALLVGRGPLEWAFDRVAHLVVPAPASPAVGDTRPDPRTIERTHA